MKKISSLLCALALMVSCFSVSAYAAENNPMPEVEATEAQDVGMQSLTMDAVSYTHLTLPTIA